MQPNVPATELERFILFSVEISPRFLDPVPACLVNAHCQYQHLVCRSKAVTITYRYGVQGKSMAVWNTFQMPRLQLLSKYAEKEDSKQCIDFGNVSFSTKGNTERAHICPEMIPLSLHDVLVN